MTEIERLQQEFLNIFKQPNIPIEKKLELMSNTTNPSTGRYLNDTNPPNLVDIFKQKQHLVNEGAVPQGTALPQSYLDSLTPEGKANALWEQYLRANRRDPSESMKEYLKQGI